MDFESQFSWIMDVGDHTKLFAKHIFPLEQALEIGSPDEILEVLSRFFEVKCNEQNDSVDKCREIIDICLDKKLDVNVPHTTYSALLHFVIKNLYNDFESVLHRYERERLDINALNNNYYVTPPRQVSLLHFAIEEGRRNVVRALLEFGADVNIQDSFGQTPLIYAVLTSQVEIAEMLLKAGANIHEMDQCQMMPINHVFNENEILRSNYLNNCDPKQRHSDLVKLLCEHGADMNFQNERGTRTLFHACMRGDFNDVQFLMQRGADLLSSDSNGNTALHFAALGNNYNLIELLFHRGVDVNAKNNENQSVIHSLAETIVPIHDALEYFGYETPVSISKEWNFDYEGEELQKSADMIQFLADNGADVKTFDSDNRTPLMVSVRLDSLEIAECLLQLTADVANQGNSTYYFSEFHWVEPSANFSAERMNAWTLFTAFLATKDCDISTFCGANLKDFEWVHPFFEECKTEVIEMKKRRISKNQRLTFFEFLTMDLMDLLVFCRGDGIMAVLEYGLYKEEFPRYQFLLKKRSDRVEKLKTCKNALIHFLVMYFKPSLPVFVADEIISYLTAASLRNFGRALYVSEKYPNGNYNRK